MIFSKEFPSSEGNEKGGVACALSNATFKDSLSPPLCKDLTLETDGKGGGERKEEEALE